MSETSARARSLMVQSQLRDRGIKDERVIEVMGRVPREVFVGPTLSPQAYADTALPIGERQTISQPFIIAKMLELLQLTGSETVLELGTGSGYVTALLSQLVGKVYSIERVPALSTRARELLESLRLKNVLTRTADGTLGWSEFAPYDAILVSAAAPDVPAPLLDQLAPGGRLVIPLGDHTLQVLARYTKTPEEIKRDTLDLVRFVPLIGRHGFTRVMAELF